MNLKELKDLIDFLIEKDITEFELERGDVKVRIKRGAEQGAAVTMVPQMQAMQPAYVPSASSLPAPVATPAGGAAPVASAMAAAANEEDLHIVKSPIVGTFYESPSPGAPAFIKVGDVVEAGQVLCIIEAMKLMNEIEADVAGEIVKRTAANNQPVEYGQPLFTIRPRK